MNLKQFLTAIRSLLTGQANRVDAAAEQDADMLASRYEARFNARLAERLNVSRQKLIGVEPKKSIRAVKAR